jgi:hypothetical protein
MIAGIVLTMPRWQFEARYISKISQAMGSNPEMAET